MLSVQLNNNSKWRRLMDGGLQQKQRFADLRLQRKLFKGRLILFVLHLLLLVLSIIFLINKEKRSYYFSS
jgi:hypothetical protein